MPSILFHPLTVILLGHQLILLTAAFASPHSHLRPLLFALLIAYTCAALATYPHYTRTTSFVGALTGVIYATRPLVYLDRLLLRQWGFEDRHGIFPVKGQKKSDGVLKPVDGAPVVASEGVNDTVKARFAFGQRVAESGRMIGTPWEAKNVAPFSASDPGYFPSRASLIVRSILIISTSFFCREIVTRLHSRVNPFYIASTRVPFLTRLNEVSRDEVGMRVLLAVGKWISVYCMLHMTLSAGTILSAILKPHESYKLRPWFGSPSDAYTLRGFWGKFWHQNLRNNFENPARFLTHRVLRLPPGSLPARYSNIFVVFFLSGLLHISSDICMSVTVNQSGALRFFCTNALGIVLEDGAREVYARYGGKGGKGMWSRVWGYGWVVVFLSWSTACWSYPQMRTVRGGGALE